MGGTCNACDGEDRAKAELDFGRVDTTPKQAESDATPQHINDDVPKIERSNDKVDHNATKAKSDGQRVTIGISDYLSSQKYIADGLIEGFQRHFFGKVGRYSHEALWPNYEPSSDDMDLKFVDWTKDDAKSSADDLAMSRGFKNQEG